MAPVITFKGATLFDGATTGAGFRFTRGAPGDATVVAKAPLGDGHWLKRAGRDAAVHQLDVTWLVASKATTIAAIEALVGDVELGELVVPDWPVMARCRLASVGEWQSQGSGTGFLLSTTLTFQEFQ